MKRRNNLPIYFLSIFLVIGFLSSAAIAQNQTKAKKEAAEIIEKYKAAIGGKENLAKIKTIETVSSIDMFGIKSKMTRIVDQTTGKFYVIREGGGLEGTVETGFDGKRTWTKSDTYRGYGGSMVVSRSNVNQNALRLPNETIDEVEYLVVRTSGDPPQNSVVKTYYNAETFLIEKTDREIELRGRKIRNSTIFSDYRKVGDISVSFSQVSTDKDSGRVVKTLTLSVRHNIDVPPTLFEFKEGNRKTAKTEGSPFKKIAWDKNSPTSVVPQNVKQETFNEVWGKINDSYYDPTFNGVDWKAIRKKYEPRLPDVKTNQELNELLTLMIGEMNQSHFRIIPASEIVRSRNIEKLGSIGLNLRLIDSKLVVSDIATQSSALLAGIRKGFVLKEIDGESILKIMTEARSKGGFRLRDEITMVRAVEEKFVGRAGTTISTTFLDGNNEEKAVGLKFKRSKEKRSALKFESKKIDADTGYIKFNFFMGALPEKFRQALSKLDNPKSLILDLRGNRGGVGNFATALAAMLDPAKNTLGTTQKRYGKTSFNYRGNARSYNGNIYILVDELSGSTSEILAAGLRENNRQQDSWSRFAFVPCSAKKRCNYAIPSWRLQNPCGRSA